LSKLVPSSSGLLWSNRWSYGEMLMAGEAAKIRIGKQGAQNGTFIAGIFGVAGDRKHRSSKLDR